jgi:hypothetical protein
MNTQCKTGDIAIITKEESGCERNIGKTVYVNESATIFDDAGACWYITPVQDGFWAFQEAGTLQVELEINPEYIVHPDAWMIPIDQMTEDDSMEENQSLVEET